MSSVRVMFALAFAAAVSVSTQSPQAAQRTKPPAVTIVSTVPPPATSLETLLTAPGLLVTRDLYRVTDDRLAQTFGLAIDAVVASSATDHLLGLRVEVAEPSATPRIRVSYVDREELAGLSQAVSQMIDVAGRWTGREDARATEAQYATLGGFIVGFHQDNRNQFGFLGAGTVDPVRTRCAVRDFAIIKADLDAAIDVLKNK